MVKETRHTFASLGLMERMPVKMVSEALGHAWSAVTRNIYSHVVISLQEDSFTHLDQLFA
jgi:integrase